MSRDFDDEILEDGDKPYEPEKPKRGNKNNNQIKSNNGWLWSRIIIPLIIAIIGAFALVISTGNGQVIVNIANSIFERPNEVIVRTQVALELTQTRIASAPSLIGSTITSVPQSTSSPKPESTQVSPGTVLFSENFDGGVSHGFAVHSLWNVVTDETGNPVIEVNNLFGKPVDIQFRGVNWSDYRIEYRVRFKKFGDNVGGDLVFRRQIQGGDFYVLSLNPEEIILARVVNSAGWERLATILYKLDTDTWYHVRMDVQGSNLKMWLDDKLLIDLEDTTFTSGIVTLDAAPNEQTQYDDFYVIAI